MEDTDRFQDKNHFHSNSMIQYLVKLNLFSSIEKNFVFVLKSFITLIYKLKQNTESFHTNQQLTQQTCHANIKYTT